MFSSSRDLRTSRSVAVLCAFLTFCEVAKASKDSVPDWVKAAMEKPLPKYSAETAAVVLMDDTTLTVGGDGKSTEHHRYVVKILRPTGRGEGMVEVPYDADHKIRSLKVWSVGPDGHEYKVKDEEIADLGYPGQGNLYSDMRLKVAKAPGRDPGGVVAYELEQQNAPYSHEADWFFQDNLPRVEESYTLEVPAGYTYGVVWAHHAAVPARDLEKGRTRWELNDTPAIDLERVPLQPSMEGLAGRMVLHYAPPGESVTEAGSWRGVGEWYEKLSEERKASNPEIAAKATELVAGKTDFYDKAEAITEFVQKEIRYFVIEKGIGGLQPHPAAEIFHNRYGDCKDKATLLAAMLSSVGLHSDIVLVHTNRGFVDPEAPSSLGNHAIGAIEIPKGYENAKLRSVVLAKSGKRYLIVDPTWEKTPFGQLESNLQGGYGVLVEGSQSEILALPVLSPTLNTVSRSAYMQLGADGSLKGSIVEKRFGDLSERRRMLYAEGDVKQQKTEMDRILGRDFGSFEVTDMKVENAAALNKDLTTSYKLSAQRYGRTMGPLLMVRPRVMGSAGMATDRKERKVPIDLSETMTAKDDFTIDLPEGYAVDEMPEPVKLDMDFASYESSSQLTGNSLHYTSTYTVRQVTLPANRYADVQKMASVIEADEQSNAVFKKK